MMPAKETEVAEPDPEVDPNGFPATIPAGASTDPARVDTPEGEQRVKKKIAQISADLARAKEEIRKAEKR
jgi:hypothetical protein